MRFGGLFSGGLIFGILRYPFKDSLEDSSILEALRLSWNAFLGLWCMKRTHQEMVYPGFGVFLVEWTRIHTQRTWNIR